ncbi:MAG: SDR family oxidoreductase [Deltaproteobacteria bacterium]|nr:SDR family oxidoreductase [Deltaproteobacteria bacterium]
MSAFDKLLRELEARPRSWLVTGAAGFIGSNLVERLLASGQLVVGLDNFATGRERNIEEVLGRLGPTAHERFRLIRGDIRDLDTCRDACRNTDVVLHQAALGSVPRSIAEPLLVHQCNVDGFLNLLSAAKEAGVRRFVYASSSSVYGDSPTLPKVEQVIGKALSPYAWTKQIGEGWADIFGRVYGLPHVGLRYFNVFGPRQDPEGPYAAVIPLWFRTLLRGERPRNFGDGETSRDFCYVANVVQANLLAACTEEPDALGLVFNVGCGGRTTLNELFGRIRDEVAKVRPASAAVQPAYADFRAGDVRHSLADISRARRLLHYEPTHDVRAGLQEASAWYVANS